MFIAWNAQGDMYPFQDRHTSNPPDIGTVIKSAFKTIPMNAFCYDRDGVTGRTWEEVWPDQIPGGQDWPAQVHILYDNYTIAKTHGWDSIPRTGIKVICEGLCFIEPRGEVVRVEIAENTDPNCLP